MPIRFMHEEIGLAQRLPLSGEDHQPHGMAYFRFSLSFREIEELMASRGIFVSHETIWQWTLKFGQKYVNALRRRQPARAAPPAPQSRFFNSLT